MSSDIESWPPPDDANAFESLCLDLWKEIWKDLGAQKNGRSGQPQAGVDVFGLREGKQVGVQCKQKDGLLRSKLTVTELEHEIEEAKNFRPALSTFIIATTGPRDARVQERARLLTEEHNSKGLFSVEVWSWKDIWHEIYQREDLLNRVGPIYWPHSHRLTRGRASTNRKVVAALLFLIVIVFSLILGLVFYQQDYRALNAAYAQLLRLSAETETATYQFRIRVEGARASADTLARLTANSDIKLLGEQLRKATEEFDAKYHSQTTPEMARQVRLARARAAIAEGHYKEAEDLVTDADVEAQSSFTVRMLLVRADAAFGQAQWSTAKKYFQKALGIAPNHALALLGVSSCALELGQFKEATSISDQLIVLARSPSSKDDMMVAAALFNRAIAYRLLAEPANSIADCNVIIEVLDLENRRRLLIQQRSNSTYVLSATTNRLDPGRTSIPISLGLAVVLARTLDLRSSALIDLGQCHSAISDSSRAIEFLGSLLEKGRRDLAAELAVSLDRRGNCYVNLGLLSNGIADLNQAVGILKPLVKTDGDRMALGLAVLLVDRGLAYTYLHQPTNGIADCNRAIEILEPMTKTGASEINEYLAMALNNRSVAFYSANEMTNAIADCSRAIEIWQPLVDGGRAGLANFLAGALNNRGIAYTFSGQPAQAISDYNRAINIRESLVRSGRSDLANDLARVTDNRGLAFRLLRRPNDAVVDHTRAIKIWKPLVEGDRPELAFDLAKAFGNRGGAYSDLNKAENAIADHQRSAEILLDLVDNRGLAHLRADLARQLVNLGESLVADGKVAEARPHLERAINLNAGPKVTHRAEFLRDNLFIR